MDVWIDGWLQRQMNELLHFSISRQSKGQTDQWMDILMDTCIHGWMGGRIFGWMDGWMNIYVWMDGNIDGWIDMLMVRYMDEGQMERWVHMWMDR